MISLFKYKGFIFKLIWILEMESNINYIINSKMKNSPVAALSRLSASLQSYSNLFAQILWKFNAYSYNFIQDWVSKQVVPFIFTDQSSSPKHHTVFISNARASFLERHNIDFCFTCMPIEIISLEMHFNLNMLRQLMTLLIMVVTMLYQ